MFGPWTLEKVSGVFDLSCVDCGDADLNEYFQKDSADYRKELMTQTYVFHETGSDVLMATVDFCGDALPKEVMPNASRRQIPFVKRGFKTFPAVKITRLRNGFVRTKGEEDADAPTIPLFFDLPRLEVESGTPTAETAQ